MARAVEARAAAEKVVARAAAGLEAGLAGVAMGAVRAVEVGEVERVEAATAVAAVEAAMEVERAVADSVAGGTVAETVEVVTAAEVREEARAMMRE